MLTDTQQYTLARKAAETLFIEWRKTQKGEVKKTTVDRIWQEQHGTASVDLIITPYEDIPLDVDPFFGVTRLAFRVIDAILDHGWILDKNLFNEVAIRTEEFWNITEASLDKLGKTLEIDLKTIPEERPDFRGLTKACLKAYIDFLAE